MAGIASIKRWVRRIAPRPRERRKVRKIDPEKLAQEVIDHPDACRYDRAARFDVTPKAIWQALGKPGVTYKQTERDISKALTPPKADQDARQGFREKIDAYERVSAMPGPLSISTRVVLPMTCRAPMDMHRVDKAAPGLPRAA